VDELRAPRVGGVGHRSRQRALAGLGADRDDLPWLHVGCEADDEIGEALERGVAGDLQGRHRRIPIPHEKALYRW